MRQITVPLRLNGFEASMECYLQADVREVAPGRSRPLVLICPGGSFRMRSQREAEPVALRFLGMGYHVAVLQYSVAPARFPQALEEAAQAVVTIRRHAREWLVDENQILLMGFSAGGHLAASLGVFWNHTFLKEKLPFPAESIRPNGLLLCYPVISMGDAAHEESRGFLLGDTAGEGLRQFASLEHHVTKDTPPTFLWHTDTDALVPVENSLLFACALKKAGVPMELHIFPHGPHGLSLADTVTTPVGEERFHQPYCAAWVPMARQWIEGLKSDERRMADALSGDYI